MSDQPVADDAPVVLSHSEVATIRAEASEDAGLAPAEVVVQRHDGRPSYTEQIANARVVDADLPGTEQSPPLRFREGDQPLPTGADDAPNIHELVMADLADRMTLGIRRYGQPLKPHNGRDPIRDAYEELLDGAAYLRQAMFERDGA